MVETGQTGEGGAESAGEIRRENGQRCRPRGDAGGGPVDGGGIREKAQTEAMNEGGHHQPQRVSQLWAEMMSPGGTKQVDKRMGLGAQGHAKT